MLQPVILPTLGLEMESAVIERWLKAEGEPVSLDEPLLVVETEKTSSEINSPVSGTLARIVQSAGAEVPVTSIIAFIEDGVAVPETAGPGPAVEVEKSIPVALQREAVGTRSVEAQTQSPARVVEAEPTLAGKVRASPAARRAARDLGIDLSRVQGSGPGGRVQTADVQRFLAERTAVSPPAPAVTPARPTATSGFLDGLPGRLVALGRKRRVTAERMAHSARSVARVTLNVEVDAAELVAIRKRLLPVYEEQTGVRLAFDDLLVKVVATGLAEHPHLNARWTDDGVFLVTPVNVGLAVAVDDGLLVLVIREADRKRLAEVAREREQLVARAREDKIRPEDVSGGTFTITNLGMYGVDSFTPIVNPPECAILGVGRIAERAVGRGGQLVLRPTINLSLSFDHRVVDGAPAARFLRRVQQLIEEPYLML